MDLSKPEPSGREHGWVEKDPLFHVVTMGRTYGDETVIRLYRNDLDAFVIACTPLPPVLGRCRNGRTYWIERAHPGH